MKVFTAFDDFEVYHGVFSDPKLALDALIKRDKDRGVYSNDSNYMMTRDHYVWYIRYPQSPLDKYRYILIESDLDVIETE